MVKAIHRNNIGNKINFKIKEKNEILELNNIKSGNHINIDYNSYMLKNEYINRKIFYLKYSIYDKIKNKNNFSFETRKKENN